MCIWRAVITGVFDSLFLFCFVFDSGALLVFLAGLISLNSASIG